MYLIKYIFLKMTKGVNLPTRPYVSDVGLNFLKYTKLYYLLKNG